MTKRENLLETARCLSFFKGDDVQVVDVVYSIPHRRHTFIFTVNGLTDEFKVYRNDAGWYSGVYGDNANCYITESDIAILKRVDELLAQLTHDAFEKAMSPT